MPNDPLLLYVEDEPFSRKIMEVLLGRAMGFTRFHIFDTSESFIEHVEQLPGKPDVIFLDIHMLPHNGFQMLSMLRQHPEYQQTRVIALTASVMNEEVELLKSSGFNGAIAKPIDQVVFPHVLEQILLGEEVWHIV